MGKGRRPARIFLGPARPDTKGGISFLLLKKAKSPSLAPIGVLAQLGSGLSQFFSPCPSLHYLAVILIYTGHCMHRVKMTANIFDPHPLQIKLIHSDRRVIFLKFIFLPPIVLMQLQSRSALQNSVPLIPLPVYEGLTGQSHLFLKVLIK